MPRLRMIAPALDVIERCGTVATSVVIERLNADQAAEASKVLVEAYRSADDALDDDGDQLDLFWVGEWGPPVTSATMCAREVAGGSMVGLSLVCLFEGLPLVAHLVVAERARRNGIAATLLASSARGLLETGIDTIELAVHAKNRGALRLYTRLGFRLDAPGCLYRAEGRPWIGYSEPPAFDGLRSALLNAMPGLEESPGYVVGVHDADSGEVVYPFANAGTGHRLPGWILALVTGWRSGGSVRQMSADEFDTAIALLSPVESAAMFDHPNLEAWRALRVAAGGDATFVVKFSSSSA